MRKSARDIALDLWSEFLKQYPRQLLDLHSDRRWFVTMLTEE